MFDIKEFKKEQIDHCESNKDLAKAIGCNYNVFTRNLRAGKISYKNANACVKHWGLTPERAGEIFFANK